MKWFFPTLSLLLMAALLGISHSSLGAPEDSSKRESKKITCSYHGKFKHSSTSAHTARQATTTACFESEISRRPNLPDEDQGDYIIETCLNETVCS